MNIRDVRFLPYNLASESLKNLSEKTGIKRLKTEGSRFIFKNKNLIINWGSSKKPAGSDVSKWLNSPEGVEKASNKKEFFELCKDLNLLDIVVPFTTSFDQVLEWLKEGSIVIGRETLNGHSGEGIVILEQNFPQNFKRNLPLYTKYIPKKSEFRVHFFLDKILFIQKKVLKKDREIENPNFKIRNLDNGYIYQRNDVKCPDIVMSVSKRFIETFRNNLDFGAIDIIYNEKYNKAYILEVNTAPGLTGTSVDDYSKAFLEFIEKE